LFFRKRSLRWKLSLLPNRKGKLLDYGCGTGEFLKTCQESGWIISGVEPSPIARKKANTLTGAEIKSSLPENDRFDAITLWHVLEHVSDLNNMVSQLANSLNDNGKLLIAVPNHESYDAKYYQQFWAGYDVPRHLWHFTQNSMQAILENNGLTIVNIIPMKLDSFYVSMLSEKYKQATYPLFQLPKAFWIGLISNWKAKNQNAYSSLIYVAQKR
jgi:2-polyprenyl-3-methyl-5-hydroxy-6-metoxy-1,4-benzoquinol methylase